jgi:hypothetical protein
MNKLVKVLAEINRSAPRIAEEVAQSKFNTSAIVNTILKQHYSGVFNTRIATKNNLFKIWESVIENAPRKYSRSYNKLFYQLDKTIKTLYNNENSSEGVFTLFRKILKNPKFEPEIYKQSIYKMGVSQERSRERKQEYADKVKTRNANRGDLVPLYVEQVYNIIDELIASNNAYDKLVAVELATGSRGIEVLKVSNYEEIKGSDNEVLVIGLAKDKGNNNLENVRLMRNLVRLNSEQVIEAVKYIRKSINTAGTNDNISKRTNKFINKAFKRVFIPILKQNAGDKIDMPAFETQLKEFTSHKARYIAGNVSFLVYGKPKKIPYESYLQNQYGHLSAESTKSYLAINIKFKNKVIEKGTVDEVKELYSSEIKELKTKIEKCCSKSADSIDVKEYRNNFKQNENVGDKISNVIIALKKYKNSNVKITQKELRTKLGYSSDIMTAAYKKARAQGII